MENWYSIVTPAIVSTFVTAILVPSLFFFLKRKDERVKRNFDVRYLEYKKYLATLEDVTRATRGDFEKDYLNSVSDVMNEILTNPANSNEALLKLHKSLDEYGKKIRDSFTKAVNELHGLKLVCSDALLSLVNQWVQLQRELLDESIQIMERAKTINLRNPESIIMGEMKGKAKKAEIVFGSILKQMRKELDISS
jgi:hypothetical protein